LQVCQYLHQIKNQICYQKKNEGQGCLFDDECLSGICSQDSICETFILEEGCQWVPEDPLLDKQAQCWAVSEIICTKMYLCLSPEKVQTKEQTCGWSLHSGCFAGVFQDCMEDGPENLPQDLKQCALDMAGRTCEAWGQFEEVSDIPSSCTNLKALDEICVQR